MCGRFTLTVDLENVASVFDLVTQETAPPRYNISPTQPIHVIYQNFGKRVMNLMRWGFVPDWVEDPADFTLLINARSETVITKPSFRSAIRHRRCIIPASGFYEWHRDGSKKTPYFFRPKDKAVIGFAGIYETYTHENGSEIDTVCFLTTQASPEISPIHHRMPVVVPKEKAERWLDCVNYEPRDMMDFYRDHHDGLYEILPVSDRVNSARNDDADLQKPLNRQALPDKESKGAPVEDQLRLF